MGQNLPNSRKFVRCAKRNTVWLKLSTAFSRTPLNPPPPFHLKNKIFPSYTKIKYQWNQKNVLSKIARKIPHLHWKNIALPLKSPKMGLNISYCNSINWEFNFLNMSDLKSFSICDNNELESDTMFKPKTVFLVQLTNNGEFWIFVLINLLILNRQTTLLIQDLLYIFPFQRYRWWA